MKKPKLTPKTFRVEITREQIANAIGANPREMYFLPRGILFNARDCFESMFGWGNIESISINVDQSQVKPIYCAKCGR